jgi:hypothetical protein
LQADVTAKGESVANLADILGTLVGIALSKARLPLVPTFAVLSCGYLVASRREVDSVELPYFNRARLAYSSCRFLATGQVRVGECRKGGRGRIVCERRVKGARGSEGQQAESLELRDLAFNG